jgi:hypothetical protein
MLVLFFNCDNNNQTSQLVVNIDAVIQQLDYINSKYINFTDPKSFWTKVTGNKKNQNIKIVFPDFILL